MAELDVAAIRARADAATEGPWEAFDEHGRDIADEGWSQIGVKSTTGDVAMTYPVGTEHDNHEVDAEFIAHSRTDVVQLLDVLADANDRLARVEALALEWALRFGLDMPGVQQLRAALTTEGSA